MKLSCTTQASNTRSRGALKTRTMRRVLSSRAADTALLPGWFRFRGVRRRRARWRGRARQERIEAIELRLPEAAVELDPVGGGAQALAAQRTPTPLRLCAALDQAGLRQHLEMTRHRRQRHV